MLMLFANFCIFVIGLFMLILFGLVMLMIFSMLIDDMFNVDILQPIRTEITKIKEDRELRKYDRNVI